MIVLLPESSLPAGLGITTAENKENQGQSFSTASVGHIKVQTCDYLYMCLTLVF